MVLAFASVAQGSELTNTVNIGPGVIFRLTRPQDDSVQSQFKSDELINYFIGSTGTNVSYLRKFPNGNFDFHLFDNHGNEVPKTKVGLDLSLTPTRPTKDDLVYPKKSHYYPFFIGQNAANYGSLFRPEDVFEITNSGSYELEIRMRLCVILTNGVPDTKAMANGLNATGHGLSRVDDFGVFTSPPLRVTIIKK